MSTTTASAIRPTISCFRPPPHDDLPCHVRPDWVVTNPPFRLAQAFAMRAFEVATTGVALLVRLQWLESKSRFSMFQRFPISRIHLFCERVAMVKGRYDPSISSATAYAWCVWYAPFGSPSDHATTFHWIPPGTKARLYRPGDSSLTGASSNG